MREKIFNFIIKYLAAVHSITLVALWKRVKSPKYVPSARLVRMQSAYVIVLECFLLLGIFFLQPFEPIGNIISSLVLAFFIFVYFISAAFPKKVIYEIKKQKVETRRMSKKEQNAALVKGTIGIFLLFYSFFVLSLFPNWIFLSFPAYLWAIGLIAVGIILIYKAFARKR